MSAYLSRYLTAMAPCGHSLTQARQAVHSLGSILAIPFMEIAPIGQTSEQSPQPVHSSSSTMAAVSPRNLCGLTLFGYLIFRLISSKRRETAWARRFKSSTSSSGFRLEELAGVRLDSLTLIRLVNLPLRLPGVPNGLFLLTFLRLSGHLIGYLSCTLRHQNREGRSIVHPVHSMWSLGERNLP